jgi:hypothetical protein
VSRSNLLLKKYLALEEGVMITRNLKPLLSFLVKSSSLIQYYQLEELEAF